MADNSASTTVATRDQKQTPALSPEREAKIREAQARTAVAKAIKGSIWGKDLHPTVLEAVVAYCRQNQLDAVRHVEVLGGNIYLTASFYRERGAPLLHSGEVVLEEPDYINADARLDELAKSGDGWAKEEQQRRLRARIEWNVPEQARAAVIQRGHLRNGTELVGVNWCGGLSKKDPVGDAEPAKTAQSRAERRFWMRAADFAPSYGAIVKPIQEGAKGALPVAVIEPEDVEGKSVASNLGNADDPYRLEAGQPQNETRRVEEDEDLALDRELALDDRRPRHTD